MTQEELNELASDCRLAFGHQAGAYNDGVDAMLRAVSIAQAQAAAQCIGKDPLCPCQDGDTCHYEGKDAWPVPQHFPFMPWSKETEMMESWAKHGAVEPVAWMHDCAALCANDVELWIDRCPHCGKPRTSPPDDLKFRPDWSGVDVLGEELHEAQKAMRLALEALNSCTPGDWSTGHVIDPYYDEKLVDAAIAALEKELT